MSALLKGLVCSGVLLSATVAGAEPMFGVSTDVGVPDGAMASLVVRPSSLIRAHVGAGYNMISTGYRAGVTVTPLPFWISPSISVSYGKYAEGDANPLARMVTGDESISNSQLEKVGYQFADGYLGLQFGRERVAFAIEAGYSRVEGKVRNLDEMSTEMGDSNTSISINQDPNVVVWSVSARIGLTVYVR